MAAAFNRQARKAMAANAKGLALKLSRTAMDYDQAGSIVRVSDERAQAVLARVFERMLRAGGKPQVMRLTEAQAQAFPRAGGSPVPGASAWLAAGVDRAGLATFVLRWLGAPGLDPIAERELAEATLRAVLSVECERPGFPVAGHA